MNKLPQNIPYMKIPEKSQYFNSNMSKKHNINLDILKGIATTKNAGKRKRSLKKKFKKKSKKTSKKRLL